MPFSPQKFREIVFQILYSLDISYSEENDIIELLMKELSITKKIVRLAHDKVKLINENISAIDDLIGKISTSYDFERIQTVERNILRLGVYELIFDENIPAKVAIAEAIRLGRKFGSPESASFINAVLDGIYKAKLGEPIDIKTIEASTNALIEIEKISKEAVDDLKKEEQE